MNFTATVINSDDPERYSLAEVNLKGINTSCTNHGSDTFYEVLKGSVIFTHGSIRHILSAGDAIFFTKRRALPRHEPQRSRYEIMLRPTF